MIELKDLKSLIAKRELVILNVDERDIISTEDDGTVTTVKGYTLTLENELVNLKSTTLTQGKPVFLRATNEVNVVGEDDLKAFMEDAEKVGDKIIYNGSMKLDVSRPKFRRGPTGAMELVVGPRAFLTTQAFSARGTKLRNDRLASVATEMAKFLEGAALAAETPAEQPKQEQNAPKFTPKKLEVTAEDGKGN